MAAKRRQATPFSQLTNVEQIEQLIEELRLFLTEEQPSTVRLGAYAQLERLITLLGKVKPVEIPVDDPIEAIRLKVLGPVKTA